MNAYKLMIIPVLQGQKKKNKLICAHFTQFIQKSYWTKPKNYNISNCKSMEVFLKRWKKIGKTSLYYNVAQCCVIERFFRWLYCEVLTGEILTNRSYWLSHCYFNAINFGAIRIIICALFSIYFFCQIARHSCCRL